MPAASRRRASPRTTSLTAHPPAHPPTAKTAATSSAKCRLFLGVQRRAVCHAVRASGSFGVLEAIPIGHLDFGERISVEHGVIGNNPVQAQDIRGDGINLIGRNSLPKIKMPNRDG